MSKKRERAKPETGGLTADFVIGVLIPFVGSERYINPQVFRAFIKGYFIGTGLGDTPSITICTRLGRTLAELLFTPPDGLDYEALASAVYLFDEAFQSADCEPL